MDEDEIVSEHESISSSDMYEVSEEKSSSSESPSGSDSSAIRKFKNDKNIRQESKMMLSKLK